MTGHGFSSDGYVAFLHQTITLEAGVYTRAQLLAMATDVMNAPAEDLAKIYPALQVKKSTDPAKKEPRPTPMEDREIDTIRIDTAAQNTGGILAIVARYVRQAESAGAFAAGHEAPRGRPGIRHVFEVLRWIFLDGKRNDVFKAAITKDGKLKKSLNDVDEAVGHMPVFDSARWLFTVMKEHITSQALYDAYLGDAMGEALVKELYAWGLDVDTIREGTPAWKAAQAHSFMPGILAGTRFDGVYKIQGSAERLSNALKDVHDALPPEHREKMSAHILKNYDSDKAKALAPLTKVLVSKGHEDQARLLKDLLNKGEVPVAVLAMFFTGTLDRLYECACSCLDTIGEKPEWLNASSG